MNLSVELPRTMLFQKALENANGPIDAEHIAYVIMLSTADNNVDANQEAAELDYLLLLLIHQIRHKEPEDRSFENIYETLKEDDFSTVQSILKISEHWKTAKTELKEQSISGVKARLLRVLLADDPAFLPE